MKNDDIPRAPLASRPADGPISQMQVAINNLVRQLRDTLFIVPETAPAIEPDSNMFREQDPTLVKLMPGLKETNCILQNNSDVQTYVPADATSIYREINERSDHIATIIKVCRVLADKLPDSTKSLNDYKSEIAYWHEQNEKAAAELQKRAGIVKRLDDKTHEQISECINNFDNEKKWL